MPYTDPVVPAALSGAADFKSTAVDHNGRSVKGSAGRLVALAIDNSANDSAVTYIKGYDSAGPVVGTDVPALIIGAPGGWSGVVLMKTVSFATAITVAGVTAGGTGGVTDPVGSTPVRALAAT